MDEKIRVLNAAERVVHSTKYETSKMNRGMR
jgi:hypothetical protein